jgi:hypothetical protein
MKKEKIKQDKHTIDADSFTIPADVEKQNKKNKGKIDPNNAVDIIAFDAEGNSFRFMGMFEAERWKEPETNAVYLRNESYNFMINMPETDDTITSLSVGSLSNKVIKLENQIKAQIDNPNDKISYKGLIDKYINYKNELRLSLFSSNSTYWGGNKGKPLLLIQRKGSHWFAMKFDSDISTIHTVSNARNTITRNAESNKRTKYGALSNLTTLGLIFIVATFLMFAGGIWSWYKAYESQALVLDKLDTTEMGQLIRECRVNLDQEKQVITDSIIDGVAQSLVDKQTENDPVGSGGE